MDTIYANAELTIIAAAGNDDEFGLPGINGTKRLAQPILKIGNILLCSTLPEANRSVDCSTWASRGWTFQEGILSKRKLIFTSDQAAFECSGMNAVESVSRLPEVMHLNPTLPFIFDHGGILNKALGQQPLMIMAYISQFSDRQLTFSGDTLKAMGGIFSQFEKALEPVYHLMGVPILPPLRVTTLGSSQQSVSSAIPWTGGSASSRPSNVLERSAEECFVIGLSWYHDQPGSWRTEFPSWSWAGWCGKVSSLHLASDSSAARFRRLHIRIERSNGSLLKFPVVTNEQYRLFQQGEISTSDAHFSQIPKEDKSNIKFIHITARIVEFKVIMNDHAGQETSDGMIERQYFARIQAGLDTVICCPLYLDVNIELADMNMSTKTYTGLILSEVEDPSGDIFDRTVVLCVEESANSAERIGCFTLGSCADSPRLSHGTTESVELMEEAIQFFRTLPRRTIRLG